MMMRNKKGERKDEIWMADSRMSGATCTINNRVFARWLNTGRAVYDPNGSKNYSEPLQGCVNNCFFIAALVSVAWARNAALRIHPNYQFYNTINQTWDPAFQVATTDLSVDNTNNLVYAESSTRFIWPCLYEKAYAIWKDPAHSQTPNIGTLLNGGSGITALLNICGGAAVQRPANIPILAYAQNKTTHPTVAQTNANPGAGLMANHTYSVLRRSGGNWELRNPCGGGLVNVPTIDNTRFSEWGYVQ